MISIRLQFLLIFLALSVSSSFSQKKIKSLTVSDEVIYATVDRPGELYIVTRNGQIQKFDADGKLLSVYKNNPAPTLFDPRDGARLFAYFRHDQHYSFLNPSFDVTAAHKIDSSFALDPWLMCNAGDYNIWVLDAADQSIKKVNVRTSTVEVDSRLPVDDSLEISSFTFMREYQGFLFLLDEKKGILIFNSLGKWIKTIHRAGLLYFNFIGEELYYTESSKTNFFNLFTAETREVPISQPGQFILFTDERTYVVHNNTIEFFTLSH